MSNFETWWERAGQDFLYALNTTTDDDIKLVAKLAWKNGAYCAEQAEQKPVAWYGKSKTGNILLSVNCVDEDWQPLYTRPVRTKDLTASEIRDIWNSSDNYDVFCVEFARAVIAKDREKNNVK